MSEIKYQFEIKHNSPSFNDIYEARLENSIPEIFLTLNVYDYYTKEIVFFISIKINVLCVSYGKVGFEDIYVVRYKKNMDEKTVKQIYTKFTNKKQLVKLSLDESILQEYFDCIYDYILDLLSYTNLDKEIVCVEDRNSLSN